MNFFSFFNYLNREVFTQDASYLPDTMKWIDYQLTRHELEEADTLCHGNWIEIQGLKRRIDTLETLLRDAGIDIPEAEY